MYMTHCTLVLDAVDEKVTRRELLPGDKRGTKEEHLAHSQYASAAVVEREGVVDNVLRSETGKQVETKRHQEKPGASGCVCVWVCVWVSGGFETE